MIRKIPLTDYNIYCCILVSSLSIFSTTSGSRLNFICYCIILIFNSPYCDFGGGAISPVEGRECLKLVFNATVDQILQTFNLKERSWKTYRIGRTWCCSCAQTPGRLLCCQWWLSYPGSGSVLWLSCPSEHSVWARRVSLQKTRLLCSNHRQTTQGSSHGPEKDMKMRGQSKQITLASRPDIWRYLQLPLSCSQ